MKLFRRQKGKEGMRRVFGFLCSPQLADDVRLVSHELSLNISAVGEHCLATGITQVLEDMQSEETRSVLREHILENHFLSQLFDTGNRYDEETTVKIRKWQLRRWELDRTAHKLVAILERANIAPSLLVDITRRLLEDEIRQRELYNRRQGGQNSEGQYDG